MASDTLFIQKAPSIMAMLMADFALDAESAAAILGNLGHESGGFRFLQEKKPLIPGSAGGYGWAQWTGPRRRAYEAYCARNKLDPAGDKANYGFLFVELKGSEARSIPAVKAAPDLAAKVKAFELNFERAGVKHYDSRVAWAKKALAAYRASPGKLPPDIPRPVAQPKRASGNIAGTTAVIVATGGGAVIANKSAEKGASAGEIASVVGLTLIIAIAAFFTVRHLFKKG